MTDREHDASNGGGAAGMCGSGNMIQWLRYVPHARVSEFEAKGWVVSDDLSGTSHGQWSVLMRWDGEGEPD